jgi:protein arginine kinase activator
MQCDSCGEAEATIHLTQMVNGAVKKLHLCEECAEESGLNVDGAMSLSDVLFGMGAPHDAESTGEEKACKACGMTRGDFKKTSRLGCPSCYDTFAEEMAPMLAAMHKGTQHAGKVPASERRENRLSPEVEARQKQLEEAVAAERYEEAARLRDLIRLEKSKTGAKAGHRRPDGDSGG